ncbi:purine-cytosine transporter [Mycolicibacterium agri]|uniref:Cytosine permease n=1 Tax=Mycolicibacterium agri TaxID=36811 RepID=A0A2A7NE14_MYCAG|nr:cytosine permease [Mycolicibacterium agri]PEG42059.1 purine-cytosine transporter [Mycolicibacterium agri]GFG49778.1 cytosine permease [Mycolicibacterium agri]
MTSLYHRLDRRLEEQADNAGPVRGTFSVRRIGMIWLAANLVVTTLLTGTLLVPAVSYGTAVSMIVAGTLCGAVVLTLVGNIGTRTGLPTMALTRGAFGTRGSLLPVTANVIILMGWSWVQAMLAGVTVDYLVESLTGFSSPILFSVLCQTIVVLIAILGHEGIARVEPWLAVLMLAIIAWIFVVAFTNFSPAEIQSIPVDASLGYTPVIVLDIVIATAISWTVLSADFNRLARSSRAGITGSGVGYTLSTVISMSLGVTAIAFVILSNKEAVPFDPATIVEAFGAPLAIVIFLSVMATNTMVVYGMATSVVNAPVSARLRFLPTALVLGLISIIGATWLGLLAQFTDFLTVIGAFFVPVFAIMIVDYYLVKRSSYHPDILLSRGGRYWYRGGVNWIAVAVWAIGAVASYIWTYVWPNPIGATIPAFVLTFVLYLLAMLPERSRSPREPSRHLADTAPTEQVDVA